MATRVNDRRAIAMRTPATETKAAVRQFTGLFLSGRYAEAMQLLESGHGNEAVAGIGGWHKVMVLFTSAYEAHMLRGEVYSELGITGKAVKEYARAQEAAAVAGLEDRRIRDAHEKCIEAEFAYLGAVARR